MGPTITQYVKNNELSFAQSPFNEIDSLALSTVAYFYLEHGSMNKDIEAVWVKLPLAICGIPQEKLFGDIWLKDFPCDKFLAALLGSPRYYDVSIGYYEYSFSREPQLQFAAMSFLLPDGTIYIAYRGTDGSIEGWKEDFNLSFMESIPSHTLSVRYLEKIASLHDASLIVGGHSKGGNLAEYAAMQCKEATFYRIQAIYNHDGPGFANPPCNRFNDEDYNGKLHKTVPESSLVGMLMEQRSNYHVVKANGVSILQHATVNWVIRENSFEYVEKINAEAQLLSDSINSWMFSYEIEDRAKLIDTVYNMLVSAGFSQKGTTDYEFFTSFSNFVSEIKELDPRLRSELTEMLNQAIRVFRDNASARGADAIQRIIPDIKGETLKILPNKRPID